MLSKVNNTENREELVNNAQEAVKNYLNQFHPSRLNITDEVYTMLDGCYYSDSVFLYQDACVNLLGALADPKLSKQIQNRMGAFHYTHLVEMLTRMRSFCREMEDEAFNALFTAHRLENYSDELDLEGLAWIQKKYTVKAEQHKKMKAA